MFAHSKRHLAIRILIDRRNREKRTESEKKEKKKLGLGETETERDLDSLPVIRKENPI